MSTNREWIDYPEALARIGGDAEFLAELLELFIADFTVRLRLLTEAVAEDNFEQIFYQAHTVKGASANLSLKTLQALALRLEVAARGKDPHAARSLLREMQRAFRHLLDFKEAGGEIRPLGVA